MPKTSGEGKTAQGQKGVGGENDSQDNAFNGAGDPVDDVQNYNLDVLGSPPKHKPHVWKSKLDNPALRD